MISDNPSPAFEDICKECRETWDQIDPVSIRIFPRILKSTQVDNEERLKLLLKQIDESCERKDYARIEASLLDWLNTDDVWNLTWLTDVEREQFYTISKQFMRDARAFDKELSFEDIAQAIRNVWIILILEKVCERPMNYHKAIFAYSMLYPYTDNLLDDVTLQRWQKQEFNQWLDRRLKGEILCAEHKYQAKVDALVQMIEEYYPRDEYLQVYQSLLHIQHGQAASLLQYDVFDEEVLLDISIAKGGASVLADGFLMDGTLNDEEKRFCVHFGFLLQLADDIQDLQQDRSHAYHTTIGVLKNKQHRRAFCEKYLSYIHHVAVKVNPNKERRLRSFIEDNCRLLIYFSLQQDAAYYPARFMYHVKERLPMRANEMKKLIERYAHTQAFAPELLDEYLALS